MAKRRVRDPEIGGLAEETTAATMLILGFYLGRESAEKLLAPKWAA